MYKIYFAWHANHQLATYSLICQLEAQNMLAEWTDPKTRAKGCSTQTSVSSSVSWMLPKPQPLRSPLILRREATSPWSRPCRKRQPQQVWSCQLWTEPAWPSTLPCRPSRPRPHYLVFPSPAVAPAVGTILNLKKVFDLKGGIKNCLFLLLVKKNSPFFEHLIFFW